MTGFSVKETCERDNIMIQSCRVCDDFETSYFVSVYDKTALEEVECLDAKNAEENDALFAQTIERYFGVN